MLLNEPKLRGSLGRKHEVEESTTLNEFLSNIEPGVHVAIGAHSGLFYIGKAEDFKDVAPYLDLHYCFATVRDQMPKTYVKSDGTGTYIVRRPYKPFTSFGNRLVSSYWSRKVDDEPPMWVIEIDGEEHGELWLLSEAGEAIERMKTEYEAMRYARNRYKECKQKLAQNSR